MDTGGKIRTGKILQELSKQNHITLISNVESPKDDSYVPEMKNFCSQFIPVSWKEPKRYTLSFYLKLIPKVFSIYPVNVLNDTSKALTRAVIEEARKGKYDLAICDFVQSALNFKFVSSIPTLLFQHNVESIISERHYRNAKDPVSRLFWWLQWKKMFRFEKESLKKFDTVIAVSEKDRELFEKLYGAKNIATIPTGVDISFFNPDNFVNTITEKPYSLVFCGSMDWLPNEDAIMYFLKNIFPFIKREIPEVSFTVVGRNPSPKLKNLVKDHKNVRLTGWVEDIRPYIMESSVYVIPIRIGGGTRMKVYEAMAMKKAIVSTSIGIEGLPVENGKNIFIEDDPENFARKTIELLKNPSLRKLTGENARSFVVENFSWQKVSSVFQHICEDTVNKVH